jgi:hypothetical protein
MNSKEETKIYWVIRHEDGRYFRNGNAFLSCEPTNRVVNTYICQQAAQDVIDLLYEQERYLTVKLRPSKVTQTVLIEHF